MKKNYYDQEDRRVNIFFCVAMIINVVWVGAVCTGLYYLGSAVIGWLNRN